MKQTIMTEIGNITDKNHNQVLRMWNAQIPDGKRPLQHHQHFNFEIMYVNSGSGTYTTKLTEHPILPGDIFVFSSNEFHSITNVGPEGLKITNLQFNPQFLWNTASDTQTHINLNFCFTHSAEFSNRLPASDAESLMHILCQIEEDLSTKAPEYRLSVKALLHLLLIHLVRHHHYLDTHTAINHEQLHSIQHTLTYIDTHFAEKITLQELSALAGLTPTYFSTLFKEVVGISLWNYISARRIDKAIHLITDEDCKKNMIDIAAECGFNNTANFNKTFKKVTGMTPREYRSGEFAEIS